MKARAKIAEGKASPFHYSELGRPDSSQVPVELRQNVNDNNPEDPDEKNY